MSDGATASGDRPINPNVMLLGGVRHGKYPYRNSLLVEGSEESLLIDPSLWRLANRVLRYLCSWVASSPISRASSALSTCRNGSLLARHLEPAVGFGERCLDLSRRLEARISR